MKRTTGVMAEFAGAKALLEAARRARAAGYRRIEAFTPFAVEGLDEALDLPRTRLPWIMLACGLLGAVSTFLLQAWLAAVDFPLNAGGRPYFSWPPFTILSFEIMVLAAAVSGFLGMLALNGLPRLHHPVFGAAGFERASQDRFFLLLEADDRGFEADAARRFLESLHPLAVTEVGDDQGG